MYVCVYACMYTHIHTYTYIYAYTYIRVSISLLTQKISLLSPNKVSFTQTGLKQTGVLTFNEMAMHFVRLRPVLSSAWKHACMYVCMYVCVYVCMSSAWNHACVYVCMYLCMYGLILKAYTCTCIHICDRSTPMCRLMYLYLRVGVYVMHAYTHLHSLPSMRSFIMRTYTHACWFLVC